MLGGGAPFVESQQQEKNCKLGKGSGEYGWRTVFGQVVLGSENPEVNQMRTLPSQIPYLMGKKELHIDQYNPVLWC